MSPPQYLGPTDSHGNTKASIDSLDLAAVCTVGDEQRRPWVIVALGFDGFGRTCQGIGEVHMFATASYETDNQGRYLDVGKGVTETLSILRASSPRRYI